MSESVAAVQSEQMHVSAGRDGVLRRLLSHPVAIVTLAVLLAVVVVAIFADLLAPLSPSRTDLALTNTLPGSEYLLGGDRSGRDILSRLIYSTRAAIESGLIATSTAVVLGVVAGLVAGYYGRIADAVGSWIANIIITLPGIIVLVALYAAIGSNTRLAMVALGVLMAPNFFRLVRALVLAVKNEPYVDAALVSGLGDLRVIGRHVLFAVRGPIIIQSTFAAGVAISLSAGLEFLGLGDPSQPSWGGMLQEAFTNIYIAPLQLVWPGATLAIVVGSLVLLGNVVRDTLEQTQRRRRSQRGSRLAVEILESSDPAKPALSLENLSVAYGEGAETKTVVHSVSLTLGRGEIVGLVGESGSGKSQTAFSILGLLPEEAQITGGSLRVAVTDPARHGAHQHALGRSIAYVAQEPMSNLDPAFTVGQQLVYGLRAATGISRAEARSRLLVLLERVGIADPQRTFDSYPHEISGGMAQRVLIAGAVAPRPEILIADEPTTALDVTVQAEILELIRDLQAEMGMSVLLVTHNFGVVADICDRVVVVHQGRVVETGPTEELFASPREPYTRQLLDAVLDVDVVREPLVENIKETQR